MESLTDVRRAGGVECPLPTQRVHSGGDLVNKRNYHQARRQKEESRRARQHEKLQRRLARGSAPESPDPAESLPADGTPPNDPVAASSS